MKSVNALLIAPFYTLTELFIQVFFKDIDFFVRVAYRELFKCSLVNVKKNIIKKLFLQDLGEGNKAS